MGIALLVLSDLFTPLQSLAQRWMTLPAGGSRRRRVASVELEPDLRYVQVRPGGAGASPESRPAARPVQPSRPLRVVRVAEAGQPRPGVRVVLSGRMDDVCAELDRLAALEAAQVPGIPARHLH